MLSIDVSFKYLKQTQNSGIVSGKLCLSKFSYFVLRSQNKEIIGEKYMVL